MLRKIRTAAYLGLLFASPCFSGFYVGASVGPEGGNFSQKSHIVLPGTFNAIDIEHQSAIGVFGSIFAGYGLAFKRYYLAGELNANLSSLKYNQSNDEFLHGTFATTYFTIKNSEGVSALFGYFLAPTTIFYGQVGYANGRIKIMEADLSINSSNTNQNGIRYGLGIKHALSPRFALIMNYSQINYSTIKSHTYDPIGNVTKDTKISPSTGQVAFGLVFNFDRPEPVFVK